MELYEKHLTVKQSTLEGAGKGLFTKVTIKKGERIVEYKGRRTTWKAVKHDNGKNMYLFFIKNSQVIDASKHLKELARYANDARGLARIKGLKNNAEYVIEGKRVFIEATKKIEAGSEIFVDYGKEYWEVVRENIEIDKKAQKLKLEKEKKKKKKAEEKEKKRLKKERKVEKVQAKKRRIAEVKNAAEEVKTPPAKTVSKKSAPSKIQLTADNQDS